jgi:hypothetical protein
MIVALWLPEPPAPPCAVALLVTPPAPAFAAELIAVAAPPAPATLPI